MTEVQSQDAKPTVDADMTETPEKVLTQSQDCKIKMQEQNVFGRPQS